MGKFRLLLKHLFRKPEPGPMLSPETERRVRLLFCPEDQAKATSMLVSGIGNNISWPELTDEDGLERHCFAALKASEGDLGQLHEAIEEDFRDLFLRTGFADDVTAHKSWLPEQKWSADRSRPSPQPQPTQTLPPSGRRSPTRRIKVGPKLSPETERRVRLIFSPEDQKNAIGLMVALCGHDIIAKANEYELERLRFAVLKVSQGDLRKLHDTIDLAAEDLSSVLRAAGFEEPTAHQSWLPDRKW